jgi:CBS domain-containing protein
MKARDLMAPFPGVVTAGDPLSRAAEIMRDWNVGMVPVVDDTLAMHLLGVITDRDIAVRCVAPRHGGRCSVGAHLTAGPLVTVEPDTDVREVMEQMKAHQVRRLPVVDGGRLVGVVALADLVRLEGPRHPLEVESVVEGLARPAVTTVPLSPARGGPRGGLPPAASASRDLRM